MTTLATFPCGFGKQLTMENRVLFVEANEEEDSAKDQIRAVIGDNVDFDGNEKLPVPKVKYRDCPTYEDFLKTKAELESQGYKDLGIFSIDRESYEQMCLFYPEHMETSITKKYDVRNNLESAVCAQLEEGKDVITTNGYNFNNFSTEFAELFVRDKESK
jgi:hypothetical protein